MSKNDNGVNKNGNTGTEIMKIDIVVYLAVLVNFRQSKYQNKEYLGIKLSLCKMYHNLLLLL